jgi:hypothetical protein
MTSNILVSLCIVPGSQTMVQRSDGTSVESVVASCSSASSVSLDDDVSDLFSSLRGAAEGLSGTS